MGLTLCPLIGSISGGNVTMLKPPELAPKTADLFKKLFPKYLSQDMTRVITCDRETSTKLVKSIKFEHIFFTGSNKIGKIIAKDASENLSKVSLELGGKNPVIIDNSLESNPSGKLEQAIRKILTNKVMKAGQICLIPDYIICSKKVQEKMIPIFKKVVEEYYPIGQINSNEYSRVNNERHFNYLLNMLNQIDDGDIIIGGKYKKNDLKIETTVVRNVNPETSSLMKDEIFGPLLPIVPILNDGVTAVEADKALMQAINFIKNRDKPLAAYFFSDNKERIDKFLVHSTSGGTTINDIALHALLPFPEPLPFGGVGHSGIGSYQGEHSFRCFTHEKGVAKTTKGYNWFGRNSNKARDSFSPPYSRDKIDGALMLMKGKTLF